MPPKRVFLGSLDDKVAQFPWTEATQPTFPIHHLVQNVVLGRTSLVTDIHLVLNSWARRNLAGRANSSLVNLIKVGGIEIPKREQNFAKLISIQKDAGIDSFVNMSREDHDLFEWMDREFLNYDIGPECPSSRSIWFGYSKLVKSIAKSGYSSLSSLHENVTERQFEQTIDIFLSKENSSKPSSRRDFEDAVSSVLRATIDSYDKMILAESSLMNLANELFHVNFSGLLSAKLKENVLVETMTSSATFALFDVSDESETDSALRHLLTIDRPLELLDQGNIEKLYSTASPVGQARVNFSEVFGRYNCNRASPSELTDIADEYGRRINDLLIRPRYKKVATRSLNLVMAGAGTGLGLLLPGTGPAIMLGGTFWLLGETLPMLVDRAMSLIGRVPEPFRQRAKPYVPLSSPLSKAFVRSHGKAVLGA